jgi:hypothetical protein
VQKVRQHCPRGGNLQPSLRRRDAHLGCARGRLDPERLVDNDSERDRWREGRERLPVDMLGQDGAENGLSQLMRSSNCCSRRLDRMRAGSTRAIRKDGVVATRIRDGGDFFFVRYATTRPMLVSGRNSNNIRSELTALISPGD